MLENRPYKFFFVNLHHKNFIFVTFLNDRELLISMFSKTHFGPVPSFTKKTRNTGKTPKYRKDHSKDIWAIELAHGVFDMQSYKDEVRLKRSKHIINKLL